MKNIFMTGLFLFVSNLLKRGGSNQNGAVDTTKFKIAMAYVQAIKVSRMLCVSLLASGLCLIFLLTGLVLVHCAILFYVPWDIATKMTVTLSCAAVYILTAIVMFNYIFAEDQWLKIFNAEKVIKELTGQSDHDASSRQTHTAERSVS